jgi:hypothetical protein
MAQGGCFPKKRFSTEKKNYFLDATAIATKPMTDARTVTHGDRGAWVGAGPLFMVVGMIVGAWVTGAVVSSGAGVTCTGAPLLNTESLPYWFVTVSRTLYAPSLR